MIAVFLNQKGGVGRTVLATHIVSELVRRGPRIILLDTDPQGSTVAELLSALLEREFLEQQP